MMLKTDTVPPMPSASVAVTDAENALCFHRFRNVCRRCSRDIRVGQTKATDSKGLQGMTFRSISNSDAGTKTFSYRAKFLSDIFALDNHSGTVHIMCTSVLR